LQRDDRGAAGTRGQHLIEALHLAKLHFERRRDRRGHDLGAAARIKGLDLDRRIVDRRQRGERQQAEGRGAREQNRDHQQSRRDRAQDERL